MEFLNVNRPGKQCLSLGLLRCLKLEDVSISHSGRRFRLGYCSCLVREERFFLFSKGHISGSKAIKSDIPLAFFIYKINFACRGNACKWREINMHILHTHSFTVHLALTRRIWLEITMFFAAEQFPLFSAFYDWYCSVVGYIARM